MEVYLSLIKHFHCISLGGLAAVLLGTAIFVSLANIAFDVYLQIEGCCGLYKDACTYMENFKTSQKNIETAQKETDATWVLGRTL